MQQSGPVVFCEINGHCQSILKARWPKVPIVSDVSMFLPPVIRANRSALPLVVEMVRKTGGRKRSRSFSEPDQFGLFLKTCLVEGLSISTGRATTSNTSVMPSGRLMLRLRSETTSGGASGLWPTPTAKANHDAPSMNKWPAYARLRRDGGSSPSRWEWMLGYPEGWTACTP